MKFYVLCLLLACLHLNNAEIVPRFPGIQPLTVDSGANPPPTVDFEDKIVIDPFTFDTIPLVNIPSPVEGISTPVTRDKFDVDQSILGGERDIILTVESASSFATFSAGVLLGAFSSDNPRGGNGITLLQYDGLDSSRQLDTAQGLRGFDFTQDNAVGFKLIAETDNTNRFRLNVFDANGASTAFEATVIGGAAPQTFLFNFATRANVDFSRVNALEIFIEASDSVDFVLFSFVTYGSITFDRIDCFTGAVLPCDTDYYNIQAISNVRVGDYLKIRFNASAEIAHPNTATTLYVTSSPFSDLQTELATNERIVDTLGALPGPNNYIYRCDGSCDIEIVWSRLTNQTYYLAIEGGGPGISPYSFCLAYRNVPVFQLFDGVTEPIFFDQIPDYPPNDRVRDYRFYALNIPNIRFSPGTYLVVNISRVEPFPGTEMFLMYESLPETAVDTGILGQTDFNSLGQQVDDMIYPFCVDVARPNGPYYEHPVITDPRVPCRCFTDVQLFGSGPFFQLTCNLTVDPCHFKYGTWYIGVKLPPRLAPYEPSDLSARINYTLTPFVVQPVVNELFRNQTIKGFVEPEAMAHYYINVNEQNVIAGESHLMVHLSNVRNGFVDIYVHRGLGLDRNLAGGREACVPANATCHTCDACNVIIEKCHFVPGQWYISVAISRDELRNEFEIFDFDRLPITFTLRATWLEDPVPERLVAGVPVSKYIGEALYDFYVIDVPPTIDTWLFVELFAKANDTEVILSILHGELPGGECYARPDFYCMTGDPLGRRFSTGTPTFLDNEPVQRESCTFMIQTCELEAGPLFLSVYGHHTGYAAYGDTTFYQVPVHYTLWADFDVALSLTSGASYSETVFERQYQHYYIRADQVRQGSSLAVEVTNIRHAIPQTVEVFVNYNYLAGNCPCYDHLYNCTGTPDCSNAFQAGAKPFLNERYQLYGDTTITCCTIIVPPSDFRPGVWYISVLGVNEDHFQYTTPIGYTLTVTILDAPQFNPLFLGQTFTGEVPQWNRTLEYTHFRLAADAIPLNDLVFKITFVQNCEFLGKHDDHNSRRSDSVWMFVNEAAPASALGFHYSCEADIPGSSFCTIVVPHCEWQGNDYFVAVQGDYDAIFTGRFTLKVSTDEVRDIELTDGAAYYDRVAQGRYKHFFITSAANPDEYLAIDLYTNSDQDTVTAYLNKDERAGDLPCFRHEDVCTTKSCCSWQILACDMEPGRYYISVFGTGHQFYDTSVEFTLTATHKPVAVRLFNNQPVTGHLMNVGDVQHYSIEIGDPIPSGEYLTFTVDNVKHGAIQAFVQYNFLAGRCPCFIWERTCSAFSTPENPSGNEWCEIRVPPCELQTGTYFFSVWATSKNSPDAPVFITPIGFIVEAAITRPRIDNPVVVLGRDPANFETFEFIADRRYVHYRFQITEEDFAAGHHVVVEIINVNDGILKVYYNPIFPGDADAGCHLAEICTSGLAAGMECRWQLPYCLVRPLPPNQFHYISIEGITGRQVASYSILIFKQRVPSITQNPVFSLDDDDNDAIDFTSLSFPPGVELNITHRPVQEPNGWTQFIRLPNVAHPDSGRGDMLELFFYRVTNNPGEPMSFDVYVHPNKPAGAHGCCDRSNPMNLGSCQNAPCSSTADTTTSVNRGPDSFGHTCNLGLGVGLGNERIDPFFGSYCIVRVWPCEFNKYCDNTTDWFVSVVPVAATDTASAGPGLRYSVQWRTRNIRLDSNGNIGSIDLTPAINTYVFTQRFDILSTSSESQGWRSFFVDWNNQNGRLSIQTSFIGSGEVYINGDEFASDTDTCNIYKCDSTDSIDCSGSGRFYVTDCCSEKYTRYFITARNTGPVDSITSVSFRIVSTILPGQIQIPSSPPETNPFVSTSSASVFPNINGVEGDNYVYYTININRDNLLSLQSLVVLVTLQDSNPLAENNNYRLDTYIRFGTQPGNYGPDSLQASYSGVEGCHGWQYTCRVNTVGETCVYQIPPCALIEGPWYIAIHNPDFLLSGTPADLPSFTIVVYVSDPPVPTVLNQQAFSDAEEFNLLEHFAIDITADNLDFDERNDFQGYWVKYIRFQLDNIVQPGLTTGSVQVWANYDSLAGPSSEYPCLDSFTSIICNSPSCFIDVTPCELEGRDIKMRTGRYYISVRQLVPSSYSLLTRVYRNEYQPVPLLETIAGTGHRAGTTNLLWRWTVTDGELTNNGDGQGNYRYVIDPVTDADDDDLPDNQYYTINITAANNWDSLSSVNLQVWRDDCTRFECSLSGPSSWCTIDALELAPCSGKGGRFFFRVENPAAEIFTLNFYRNETTIQTLIQDQTITEIVYPYEYQEYYFEAFTVGEGATLSVRVCSICGDVEAFIRRDLPAGPYPGTGIANACALDTCRATGPVDTSFKDENNCCTIFLDSCEYEQRGYYIGVRGVTTTFPGESNANLYLPAKYNIQAHQTIINTTVVSFSSCPQVVEYVEDWDVVPRQYALDVETVTVGTILRFSLRVNQEYLNVQRTRAHFTVATIWAQINQTFGYTDTCNVNVPYCETSTECSFELSYCDLAPFGGGRYYIWANAPRGSEIVVERWEPYVPIITTDVRYHATINGPESGVTFDLPVTPNYQLYRFDLDPHDDVNYYEKFFVRIIIEEVNQGTLGVALNSGYTPYLPFSSCPEPFYFDSTSCRNVNEGDTCFIEIQYSDLLASVGGNVHDIPTIFWLTIFGLEQECELHSIQYDFIVQTHFVLTYFPIQSTECEVVTPDNYNFHRLRPRESEFPQQSILQIAIEDLDGSDESVNLLIRDRFLATTSGAFSFPSGGADSYVTEWLCGYEDLYLSVHGENSLDGEIDYRMTVNKVPVRIKELFVDTVYHADDDDDDACPHEHDFYFFRTAKVRGHHRGSFLRIAVDSEFPTQVYINKNTIAWKQCHDSGYGENDPSSTGTTTVNVYDFCDFTDGIYYVTVVSNGPYYVYTDIRDDAKNLTLGEVFRDTLEPAMYQMYTLEICKGWYEPDDRLVIEISDVENGSVFGFVRFEGNPGTRTNEEFDSSCSEDSAFASYGEGQSGHDFLLVNHCALQTGTYHILIRASPPEGSPSRNCEHVNYRIFPYLIDYEIDPVTIGANVGIVDVVDFYTINRFEANSVSFANYYRVLPLCEPQGYFEFVSHAVARLTNVNGGLLKIRVMSGHLSVAEFAYIDGDIRALTKSSLIDPTSRIQSGTRRNTYQRIMDARNSPYQSECDGCSDFCCEMSLDDIEEYRRDSSCAVWVPSCYLVCGADIYLAVEPVVQFYEDTPVTYNLMFKQMRDYIFLQPDTNRIGSFENDNWDYRFYYSISAEPQSMRWRVVVTEGEGVLVTVRNHRCPLQADWVKEVWCDASYFDRPWNCDIEIPTRAEHPGDNAYFIAVYGKNATFSIAFWRGRENCHALTGTGRSDGLDFCAGLIPYATWRWDNYNNLDNEAHCLFTQLYEHFRVQPCWSGVSAECNSTLQAFACYESFHRCDAQGFAVGTCRDACDAVVYECVNWFESVDLEHYNCTSSRYLDSRFETCSGGENFNIDQETQLFLGDEPNLILFRSSPSSSTSSASIISVSYLVAFVAVLLLLV